MLLAVVYMGESIYLWDGFLRKTRPSILCVTHQMSRKKRNHSVVLDGTGSVNDDTGWYLVSISWYCLVLGGTGSAKGVYACIYWKKWRFGRVLPMPDILLTNNRR